MTANTARRPPSRNVEVVIPRPTKPEFKQLGGSDSDHFNQMLATQTLATLWVANSDDEQRNRQYLAATATMIGAKPADELEGMLISQMIACHAASLECYRRAMLAEQSFEGRQSQPQRGQQAVSNLHDAARRVEQAPRQGPAGGPGRACHRPGRWPGHRRQRHPGGRGPPAK